jgi:TatD DNase family protein
MQLVDTHCHIQSAGLSEGERTTRELWAKAPDLSPDTIIANAKEQSVETVICVGCDLADSQLAVDFVKAKENTYASIGIHPHEAQLHLEKTTKTAFESLLEDGPLGSKIVAIGECGLDYFYEHSPKEAQVEILKSQIDLALQHDLPLIFHVRDAFEDFWPIFESYPAGSIRGVLHSFTDSIENLERAVKHGLYIGVNGIATFAKHEAQIVMYRTIPQRSLLLETDAPFLTPIPFRGTINEPKHIRTIAEFLAELRGEKLNNLAEITTNNAKTLFRL